MQIVRLTGGGRGDGSEVAVQDGQMEYVIPIPNRPLLQHPPKMVVMERLFVDVYRRSGSKTFHYVGVEER